MRFAYNSVLKIESRAMSSPFNAALKNFLFRALYLKKWMQSYEFYIQHYIEKKNKWRRAQRSANSFVFMKNIKKSSTSNIWNAELNEEHLALYSFFMQSIMHYTYLYIQIFGMQSWMHNT